MSMSQLATLSHSPIGLLAARLIRPAMKMFNSYDHLSQANCNFSQNNIKVINSRKIGWMGHVAGEHTYWSVTVTGRDHA